MTHTFTIDGEYFLYDVESGSLFNIDRLVYLALNNDAVELEKYSASEIEEAKAEINAIKEEGCFEAEAPLLESQATIKSKDIKSICLHICHDCNLNCGYCFADKGCYKGIRELMSFDVAKNAIDFLLQNSGTRKNLEVDFFGGEPLMNFDVLKQVVEYAKTQGAKYNKIFKFTTTTNGVLLNKEVANYLNEEMDNVVLSLDGRKEVNDAVRKTINGKGSFDIIVDNFKYFREIRKDKSYFVRGTFTALNKDFSKDVLFLNKLGFDQISMEPVVLEDSNPLALKETDLPVLLNEYETLVKEYVKLRKSPKSWFSFFHFVVSLQGGPCYKKRLVGCGAGCEYLAVSPTGEMYPCHQFVGEKEYMLGNVFEKVLDAEKREKLLDTSLLTKPVCQNCWAKYHCSGGCIANAIHFNNDINKPYELACSLVKKRLECALYVFAKEKE